MERNFASLATDLGGMVRKTARLRDKGDQVVKTLQDFASTENGRLRKSLEGLAECCSAMEDCNQFKVSTYTLHPCKYPPTLTHTHTHTHTQQIDRMEAKVVKPLMEYESICRKAKVCLP